jgi:hypothetical protein
MFFYLLSPLFGVSILVTAIWLTICQRMAVAGSFLGFGTVVDIENA